WLDWNLLSKHADVHRFVTLLNERRLMRDLDAEERKLSLIQLLHEANITWHGIKLNQPDWSSYSHSIALCGQVEKLIVHLIFNAYWEPLNFELPPTNHGDNRWRRWIDTALDSPNDIVTWQSAAPITGSCYEAQPHSVVVLYADVSE